MLEEAAVLIFGTLFYVGALVLLTLSIREAHRILQGHLDDRRIRRHRAQMRAHHDTRPR